jgi:hypothetical protein
MSLKRIIVVVLFLTSLIVLSFIGDLIKAHIHINVLDSYNYASEVLAGAILDESISHSNSNECNVPYSNVRVIESFKGNCNQGVFLRL